MLQNFKYLFLILFICGSAYGQALPIRNDTPTALRDLGANLNVGKNFAVDSFGQTKVGAVSPGTGATNLGKAVNSAYGGDGSVGVMGLGVRNDTLTTLTSTNGTFVPFSSSSQGVQRVSVIQGGQIDGSGLIKSEDSGVASGDGGVFVLAVAETALTGTTGATNEYGAMKTDGVGRLITSPAVPGETWSACSGVAAGTVDVAIKAAVPSNRMYITSLTCYNNSTTATTIDIDDGAASIWKAYLGTTTLGNNQYSQTFPVPLRGSVNTALNVKPSTTASGTFCCAAGYISIS